MPSKSPATKVIELLPNVPIAPWIPINVFCSSPLKQSPIKETANEVNNPIPAPTNNLLATIIAKLLIKMELIRQ